MCSIIIHRRLVVTTTQLTIPVTYAIPVASVAGAAPRNFRRPALVGRGRSVRGVLFVARFCNEMCVGCRTLRANIRQFYTGTFVHTFSTRFPDYTVEIGNSLMSCGARVFLKEKELLVFTPLAATYCDWFDGGVSQLYLDLHNANAWLLTRHLPRPTYKVFGTPPERTRSAHFTSPARFDGETLLRKRTPCASRQYDGAAGQLLSIF